MNTEVVMINDKVREEIRNLSYEDLVKELFFAMQAAVPGDPDSQSWLRELIIEKQERDK